MQLRLGICERKEGFQKGIRDLEFEDETNNFGNSKSHTKPLSQVFLDLFNVVGQALDFQNLPLLGDD